MASRPIHGLSLCSGIGGLDLAMQLVYGDTYRTVGFIERCAYATAVLVARMEEKALDQAPIWDDLTTFNSQPFSDKVDLITAGFPCQPFSVAGKRQGKADDRWLWPFIAEHIDVIRPSTIFIENVPGLRRHGLTDILRDLAALGFDAEWMHLSASDIGASHKRRRFFLLAHTSSMGCVAGAGSSETEKGRLGGPRPCNESVNMAGMVWPPGPEDEQGWADWDGPQPGIRRDPNGSAPALERRDRLRVCGNAVVPAVAAAAFITLTHCFYQYRPSENILNTQHLA